MSLLSLSLLRIVFWIGLYVSVIEIGLEVRTYYRGFDSILLGCFQHVPILRGAISSAFSKWLLQSDGRQTLHSGARILDQVPV